MKDHLFFADAVTISTNLIKQFDKNLIREKLLLLYERLYEQHMNHSNYKPLKAWISHLGMKKY